MAAEALCALGRGREVVPWTQAYLKRATFLKERPQPTRPIAEVDWSVALGNYDRFPDWVQYFTFQMEEMPWPALLELWVGRLAPGFAAVALHGPIRTCHAVRALGERDTPLRRGELANGLAHWAAGFHRLPQSKAHHCSGLLPSRAIKTIRPMPLEQRAAPQSLVQALKDLDAFSPFAESVAMPEISISGSKFLSDLTETLAAVYVTSASDFLSVLGFVHAVTGPASLRMISPFVSERVLDESLRYAWQAAAAMYVRFGRDAAIVELGERRIDPHRLIDDAVSSGDEHAIKFTEVCLREHALNPKPAYLTAAPRAVAFLAKRLAESDDRTA